MANSIFADSPVQAAPSYASFGPGGQMYIADIFGGFNVSADLVNPLFSIKATDNSPANAAFLTNLTETNKIGSTMEFKATQLGLRVVPTGDALLTPKQVASMKSLLSSAIVTLTYGSNDTKIGEFSGLHLMAPVDNVAGDSTNTCATQNGAIGNTGWINLKAPVCIEANLNIGGSVRFTKAVPTDLYSTPNSFAFIVVLAGLKVVKS